MVDACKLLLKPLFFVGIFVMQRVSTKIANNFRSSNEHDLETSILLPLSTSNTKGPQLPLVL